MLFAAILTEVQADVATSACAQTRLRQGRALNALRALRRACLLDACNLSKCSVHQYNNSRDVKQASAAWEQAVQLLNLVV